MTHLAAIAAPLRRGATLLFASLLVVVSGCDSGSGTPTAGLTDTASAPGDGGADAAARDTASDAEGIDVRAPDLGELPDAAPTDETRFAFQAPAQQRAGRVVPIRVTALRPDGRIDVGVDGVISGVWADEPVEVLLRRGTGAFRGIMPDDGAAMFTIGDHTHSVSQADAPLALSGTLGGDALTWGPDAVVEVTGDLSVPAGETLEIREGTVVLLAAGANVDVDGELVVAGDAERPVTFAPDHADRAWGGLSVATRAQIDWAMFIGGGGDAEHAWGHSDSQPIVFGEPGSTLALRNVVFSDAPGKSIGALEAEVTLEDALVTRVDTGGEFYASWARVSRAYFIDIPAIVQDDAVDDDNDGIYFWKARNGPDGEPLVSTLTDAVFVNGQDDAIDHNEAVLEVSRVWVDTFWHEGIAASNGGSIRVDNAYVTRCQQGIEAGGVSVGADILATHSVFVANERNVRWGDSSGAGFRSALHIRESVIADAERHTVLNYHNALDGMNPEAEIVIEASLVDDAEWAAGAGSIHGEPVFTGTMELAAESPGYGAAEDGASFGLTAPLGW